MNAYDILNINKTDIEEAIKKTIVEVKKDLVGLDIDLTCKIYSGAISDELRKRHILNRMIDTEDFGCNYNHRFNIVPDNDKYYLIDLTYNQFKNDDLEELKKNGYMLMNDDTFKRYLEITGYSNVDITLKKAFDMETKKIR